MNLPKREKVLSWAINLVLIGTLAFIAYNTFKTQDIMLIDKEAREAVEFCEDKIEVCVEAKRTYEGNVKKPLFKVLPEEIGPMP